MHPSTAPNEDHIGTPKCRSAPPWNASGPVVTALVPVGVTDDGLGVLLSTGGGELGVTLIMADGVDGVSDVTGGGGEVGVVWPVG